MSCSPATCTTPTWPRPGRRAGLPARLLPDPQPAEPYAAPGQHHRPVRRREPDRTLALPDGQDPQAAVQWRITNGPWFSNAVATLCLDNSPVSVRWDTAAGTNVSEITTVELQEVSGRNQETGTLQRGGV